MIFNGKVSNLTGKHGVTGSTSMEYKFSGAELRNAIINLLDN